MNFKIVIHSTFVMLLIVEVALRINGFVANYAENRYGYYESPYHNSSFSRDFWTNPDSRTFHLKTSEFNYTFTTNSLGYRDKEWNWENMKSKTRILALGDSFTMGDGADTDSSWIRILEKNVNDTMFYFMNAGIIGSDPFFDNFRFKNLDSLFHPQIVIFCINRSDIDDIIFRGGAERFTNDGIKFKKGPWWEPLYASSHILRLFINQVCNSHLLLEKNRYNEYYKETIIKLNKLLKVIVENAGQNSRIVVVFHPSKYEVSINENLYKGLIDQLRNDNINVIDLYSFYQHDTIKNDILSYYWNKDGHHNSKGYELMAKGIYKGLIDQDILFQ